MQTMQHVLANATVIASTNIRGAQYRTDLYASWQELCRTKNGHYTVANRGGAAVSKSISAPMTREQAIDWIATEAQDAITGYGFTREQAELMVDGNDAGRPGYRGQ